MKSAYPDCSANSAAEQAAQAIVDLINLRPTSPRSDEIAEIIKRLVVIEPAPGSCSCSRDLDREYGPANPRP